VSVPAHSTKSRQPNDPKLLAARALMAEEFLVDAIAKALKKALR
jgi:hypothetical protein